MPDSSIVQDISIALIDLDDDQSRQYYDDAQIEELADSIRSVGLINPITLRPHNDRYILVAGSCRLRAYQLLRRSFIPAVVVNADKTSALGLMAHENLYRADLTPLEEGTFLHRLKTEHHYTDEQLAKLTNKPVSYVQARLTLITLDDYIRQAVHIHQLHISHALLLAQFDNPDTRQQYTQYAISSGASLNTLRYWLQQYNANKGVPTSSDQPPARPTDQPQISTFGWYCFGCQQFHPAPDMQTIHLCNGCFLDLKLALEKPVTKSSS